jgi:AraC-like DNA-binding protein/mannose-6-phosphate isomerase-like protein (cupin superfamily)
MKVDFSIPMQKVGVPSEQTWVTFDDEEISGKLVFLCKHWWTPQNVLLPHTHNVCEFTYIVGGEGSIFSRGVEYKLSAGDILVVEPNTEHKATAHPKNPFELFTMGYDFHQERMQADPAVFGVDRIFWKLYEIYANRTRMPIIRGQHDIRNVLFKLMDEISDPQICQKQLIRAYLLEIFVLLTRKVTELIDVNEMKIEGKEPIHKAKEFIRTHFHEPLDLEAISSHVYLSPSHFSRLFKVETRLSPVEYLNHVRIEEAKRLLIYSDLTLTEIANRVGINSIHYFSHKFKKMEGVPPLEYRRAKKEILFRQTSGREHK